MIHIDFDPEKLEGTLRGEWTAWETRARQATDEVLDAWEASRKDPNDKSFKGIFDKPSIQSVWGDLKDWLLKNVFNNKCAYCETPVLRSSMHAEHYRPKGRVTQNKKKVKIKDANGEYQDHPGYFWLAFHWTNLLPSCAFCNTINGKKNEFPIPQTTYLSVLKSYSPEEIGVLREELIRSNTWPDIFYYQPVDLNEKEGRWLLHPYFDDPQKSLRFDDFGKVISIGDGEDKQRGEWSIKVYNLNDERLATERRRAQIEAFRKFHTATDYHVDQGLALHDAKLEAKAAVSAYTEGKAPYSAAVLAYLHYDNPTYF